jgi:outer membrane protein assembly factor BamB
MKFKKLCLFIFILVVSPVWAQTTPSLHFVKSIGDVRGKSLDNIAISIGMDGGAYLLQNHGRVVIFDKDGAYTKSLEVDMTKLNWRHHFRYMTVLGQNVLLGTCEQDYPWVYDAKRVGDKPGEFASPRNVTADETGRTFVADTKNKRIQIFSPGNIQKPEQIVALDFEPSLVAVKQQPEKTLMLVGDNQRVQLLSVSNKSQQVIATHKIRNLSALAIDITQGNKTYLATNNELFTYVVSEGKFTDQKLVAPSYHKQWPAIYMWDVSFESYTDGKIYFASDNYARLNVLNPADDSVKIVGELPWRARTIAFGPNHEIYAAREEDKKVHIEKFILSSNGLEKAGRYIEQSLYDNQRVPVWGMLWDKDGLLVRVVEEGHKKGWPALAIKRVMPDGQFKPFLDFGHLFAVRAKFHPSVATYAMQHDQDGNIVFAAMPLKAVYKVTSVGTIIWESSLKPQGDAEKINFGDPRDLAIDSQNRIWVTDSVNDQVLCLSTNGKLMYQFGMHVGVDDTQGKGFNQPCGLAITKVDDQEFLYVGDQGNQRILKYCILNASTDN